MRLIDSDKLLESFRKMHKSFNGTPMEDSDALVSFRSVARLINRQETVKNENKECCYNGGWISCKERMPENEREVEITYITRKLITGEIIYLTARAFYEDGTVPIEDSKLNWSIDNDFEYDEEKENYIISEGWWASSAFTEEVAVVDKEVVAWRPIGEPYKGE